MNRKFPAGPAAHRDLERPPRPDAMSRRRMGGVGWVGGWGGGGLGRDSEE